MAELTQQHERVDAVVAPAHGSIDWYAERRADIGTDTGTDLAASSVVIVEVISS